MVMSSVITDWVPTTDSGEHTAAYKIFHYYFECTIAQMHLYSAEYLLQSGTVTSGNQAVDRAMAEQRVHVRLTIAAIAELLEEGASVEVVQAQDCAKIYTTIHAHLNDWLNHARTNLNALEVPKEDLEMLDRLAAMVYPHARFYLSINPFHGRLFGALEAMGQRRGGARRVVDAEADNAAAVSGLPLAHTPMADAIAQPISERRKAWR